MFEVKRIVGFGPSGVEFIVEDMHGAVFCRAVRGGFRAWRGAIEILPHPELEATGRRLVATRLGTDPGKAL